MKAQPQYLQDALLVLQAKLDPDHPGFTADKSVREALRSIRPYLQTWVLPLVEVAQGEHRWQREGIAVQADRVRGAIEREKQATGG